MIKAIIFDCFGVLTTDGWLPFKDKYFGHEPDLLQQATNLNKQADAGLISYQDFLRAVSQLAAVSPQVVSQHIDNNVPNEQLFEYIKQLKMDYKIGMLSNAADNWLVDMFTPEQVELFDAIALSYETGFIKPQIGAYEISAERLGVSPNECIFVDDQERYCTGAQDIGMQAVWYRDFDQAKTDLKKLLQS